MNKRKAFLLFTILLTILTFAVPSILAQDDPVELTLMRFFGDCFDEFGETTDLSEAYGECGIIQTLTNAFNASQNAIQVETVPVDWPGFTELNTNLAAGTPPDIMVLHGIRIPNYASRGLLTPLDTQFDAFGIDVGNFTDSAAEYVSYNDQFFGVPLDLHGHLWHINLDLWDQADMLNENGDPVLPIGKDAILAAAETFKEATDLPMLGVWTNDLSRNWMTLIYQQGGTIETDDGMPNINSTEGLEALNLLLELRDAGHMPDNVDYTAAQENFLNGQVGSHINGTWVVNFYDEQAADPEAALNSCYVTSFPQFYDQPAAWASTHAWIVPLGLDANPERMEAIMTFLKYLNDNNIEWARTGHLAINKSVLASDAYNNLAHRDEYASFATDSVVMPRQNWITAFEDVVDEEIEAAFIGEKSPQQALDDAQSRLEDFALFGQ